MEQHAGHTQLGNRPRPRGTSYASEIELIFESRNGFFRRTHRSIDAKFLAERVTVTLVGETTPVKKLGVDERWVEFG